MECGGPARKPAAVPAAAPVPKWPSPKRWAAAGNMECGGNSPAAV